MRNLGLGLTLVFLPLIISAQFQWEEVAEINKEFVEIIHITKENEIVGVLEYPPQIVSSKDEGENWEIIYTGAEIHEFVNDYDKVIAENEEGELFLPIEESIFKLDMDERKLSHHFDLSDEFFTIRTEDLAFLPNGNLLVGDSRYLQLYGPSGGLIKTHEWWTHSVKFLIGEGDVHYVKRSLGASNYMTSFNSDLSDIPSGDGVPAPRSGNFTTDGKRLFHNTSFSDDGITWKEYPNQLSGLITLFPNKNVHLISNDKLFLSKDSGETFDQIGAISESIISYSTSSHALNNQTIFYWDEKSNEEGALYKLPAGQEPVLISNRIGNPSINNIEAFNLENIFIAKTFRYSDFINSENQDWREIDSDFFDCSYHEDLLTTLDGSIISSNTCISNDQGESWSIGLVNIS